MAQRNSEKVVIWGDSLAKGVIWNNERRRHGYSRTTAAEIVAEKLGVEIVNRAKFGYTAPQGLEMMERDFAEGIVCETALLEFGGNDCNFDWAAISEHPEEPHDPATLPDQFVESLRSMVGWLLNRGIRPVLMTLPPIDSERYFRFLVGDKLSAETSCAGWAMCIRSTAFRRCIRSWCRRLRGNVRFACWISGRGALPGKTFCGTWSARTACISPRKGNGSSAESLPTLRFRRKRRTRRS